jgi:hypothetical protein
VHYFSVLCVSPPARQWPLSAHRASLADALHRSIVSPARPSTPLRTTWTDGQRWSPAKGGRI